MPRRAKYIKKVVGPDPKYGSPVVSRFINKIMMSGKKATAQGIVYDAFERINKQMKTEPLPVFEQAMKNATPALQVKSRRVGGATYQVPMEVSSDRRLTLAIRWILSAANERSGKSFPDKLAGELIDAFNETGAAIRKRDETHKMAEANRAFSHYRV